MSKTLSFIPSELVERAILLIRAEKVMLDSDLAEMYGVELRTLVQAVKRNQDRFPKDFMFQLSAQESKTLISQSVISKNKKDVKFQSLTSLRSQNVISKGRGGRRYKPYVFTEQGVAMLSSVLNSSRAVAVNIEIMRAFVRLRKMISSNAELAQKVTALEKKYDSQFKVVFDAIRELMTPPESTKKRRIGF